jgi:hypothetical protein
MNHNQVAYAQMQQGYRPRTNPRPLSGLRGVRQGYRPSARAPRLGQLADWEGGGGWDISANGSSVPPTPPIVAPPSTCSTWDVLLYGEQYCNTAEQAQIQSVCTNCAAMYGASSPQCQACQAAANQQKAQVPADNSNIENYYDTQVTCNPLTMQCGSAAAPIGVTTTPLWVWVALAAGALLVMR